MSTEVHCRAIFFSDLTFHVVTIRTIHDQNFGW